MGRGLCLSQQAGNPSLALGEPQDTHKSPRLRDKRPMTPRHLEPPGLQGASEIFQSLIL